MRQRGVQRTYNARPGELARHWYVVDASGKTLGRLATKLAVVLMGKHRAAYTPHVDTGDFVVVTNASKVAVTGGKAEKKEYLRYSGYMGGLKSETLGHLLARKPERVVEQAVRRMLPKTLLGRKMLQKLKVYAGPEHPHSAQRPEPLAV